MKCKLCTDTRRDPLKESLPCPYCVERLPGLHAKALALHQELGHPFGDRDDFAAFMDTDLDDISFDALLEVYEELCELKTLRSQVDSWRQAKS